ncbi:MAG: ABC transporter ATP-binding protein [Dehalococcoidia bacterium]|nr:ABC transporter ATP-binding protein [Dehalococcoidia bacterium]
MTATLPIPHLVRDQPVIVIHGVTKTYTMGDQTVHALKGIDCTIERGEMVAIMGPSGSGKSTLMNVIGCLDVSSAGSYELDGVSVGALNDDQLADIRSGKIGFVFQSFNLLARTSALDNVQLPLVYAGVKDRKPRAMEALTRVGLGDRVHHKPNELSGGQQQRVAIARAIVNRPAILLADEPTGALDSRTSEEIMALFQSLNKDDGMTVIFVTHEKDIGHHTGRIIHIRDGAVQADERVMHPLVAADILRDLDRAAAEAEAAEEAAV